MCWNIHIDLLCFLLYIVQLKTLLLIWQFNTGDKKLIFIIIFIFLIKYYRSFFFSISFFLISYCNIMYHNKICFCDTQCSYCMYMFVLCKRKVMNMLLFLSSSYNSNTNVDDNFKIIYYIEISENTVHESVRKLDRAVYEYPRSRNFSFSQN